jgi:hypothetical protein
VGAAIILIPLALLAVGRPTSSISPGLLEISGEKASAGQSATLSQLLARGRLAVLSFLPRRPAAHEDTAEGVVGEQSELAAQDSAVAPAPENGPRHWWRLPPQIAQHEIRTAEALPASRPHSSGIPWWAWLAGLVLLGALFQQE